MKASSSRTGKNAKTKTTKTKNNNGVRVMFKLGWSGERVSLKESSSGFGAGVVSPLSTLQEVVDRMDVPMPIGGTHTTTTTVGEEPCGELSIVYLRHSVRQAEWKTVRLADVLGGSDGGSALLTLRRGTTPATVPQPCASVVGSASPKPTSTTARPVTYGTTTTTTMPLAVNPAPSETASPSQPPTRTGGGTHVPVNVSRSSPLPGTITACTCREAIEKLTTSHFDVDSRECVLTLIKVVDNVLQKPGDARTRSIRVGNNAFWNKIGCKKGGVDFLLACGFTPDHSVYVPVGRETVLRLEPRNESSSGLYEARVELQAAAKSLGIPEAELPRLRPPPPPTSTSTTMSSTTTSQQAFDPFRTQSFNVQAAAVGAPNATGIAPDGTPYVSRVEKELQTLQARAQRTRDQRPPIPRRIQATRPGAKVVLDNNNMDTDDHDVKQTDASLLAARLGKMEEERRKREGAFTTKAMRDLETLQKAKVYTHARLRIGFPDGMVVSVSCAPEETVEELAQLLRTEVLVVSSSQKKWDFDLYVTPPRRVLPPQRTLEQEGLVPAARIFVSWTQGTTPMAGTDYVRPELFDDEGISTSTSTPNTNHFPASQPLVDAAGGKRRTTTNTATKPKGMELDEDDMVARMMGGGGKSKSTLGRTPKHDSRAGGAKPKWFKR